MLLLPYQAILLLQMMMMMMSGHSEDEWEAAYWEERGRKQKAE
jgi:hypothetical protein